MKLPASRSRALLCLVLGLTAPSALGQTGAQHWTLSSTLRGTVTDNLLLNSESGTDLTSAATVGLSYSRSQNRLSFGGFGWASGGLFGQSGRFNGVRYGLGGRSELQLGPRAVMNLVASYADGLNLEDLYATRLGLPQLDVKAFSATSGLSYKLTPNTSAGVAFDAFLVRYRTDGSFDSATLPGDSLMPADVVPPVDDEPPVAPPPPGLDLTGQVIGVLAGEGLQTSNLDYWSFRAGANVEHQFSPRTGTTASFGYRRAYEQSDAGAAGQQFEGQFGVRRVLNDSTNLSFFFNEQDSRYPSRFSSHSLGMSADKAASRRFRLNASLGASYLQAPERESSGWQLIGGAGLSLRLKRTSLASSYQRNRYQSLLAARNYTTDSLFVSFGHRFSRRLSLSAYGHGRAAYEAEDRVGSYRTFLVGTSLGRRFKKRSSLGASYTYQRFHRRPDPPVSRFVLSAFIGSGLAWK